MWAHSEQTAAGINGEHRNPRYLVDYVLPENVVATTDRVRARRRGGHHLCRAFDALARLAIRQAFIDAETPVLSAPPRALSPNPGPLMSEVIGKRDRQRATRGGPGPNHAEEICRGGLSVAVIASEDAGGETL